MVCVYLAGVPAAVVKTDANPWPGAYSQEEVVYDVRGDRLRVRAFRDVTVVYADELKRYVL